MKHLILLIILTLNINCLSQKNKLKPPFSTQGEQENYWAQELFKKDYKKTLYKVYPSKIESLNETEFSYGNKTFKVYDVNETFKIIFSKGLLYPQLISGFTNKPRKSDKELDSLTSSEQFYYELNSGYSFTIMNLNELSFLSNSPKVKRFEFWLFRPAFANPTAYLFELTNKKANKSTSLKEFIENSKLTFLKEGWVIL